MGKITRRKFSFAITPGAKQSSECNSFIDPIFLPKIPDSSITGWLIFQSGFLSLSFSLGKTSSHQAAREFCTQDIGTSYQHYKIQCIHTNLRCSRCKAFIIQISSCVISFSLYPGKTAECINSLKNDSIDGQLISNIYMVWINKSIL